MRAEPVHGASRGRLRSLFFGTSAFAIPSLCVTASRTQLSGVVTQPDRPAGRGHKVTASPVKVAAVELNVPVHEPKRLTAFAAEIAAEPFDVFVLASYGRILPASLLELPRCGALNVHPSLLPQYRGATPIQSALRHGDDRTGVSILLMDRGMDTGPLVLQTTVAIEPDETYGELHDRLAQIGAALLSDALDLAQTGELQTHPQTGSGSVTTTIATNDLAIEWSWTPQRIVDHVRAFSPRPAARAVFDRETLKILRAHVGPDGTLIVDELIAPNRGRMSGSAYLRGRSWPRE